MISTKSLCTLLSMVFFFSIIGFSFAADGFEYLPDEATLGLWHFDGATYQTLSVEVLLCWRSPIGKNYERGN